MSYFANRKKNVKSYFKVESSELHLNAMNDYIVFVIFILQNGEMLPTGSNNFVVSRLKMMAVLFGDLSSNRLQVNQIRVMLRRQSRISQPVS